MDVPPAIRMRSKGPAQRVPGSSIRSCPAALAPAQWDCPTRFPSIYEGGGRVALPARATISCRRPRPTERGRQSKVQGRER